MLADFGHQGLNGRRVALIQLSAMRLSAGLLNITDNSFGTVLCANISNDDFGAGICKPPCNCTAYVARTAGDQSNVIV